MPLDANLVLAPLTTSVATANSAALNLKTGTPRRGLKAKVFYSAAANASGSNNFVFRLDQSPDGANWYPLCYQLENPAGAGTQGVALTTTPQAGELTISFETSAAYVRLGIVIAGAGTSPTVTYSSMVGIARP